MVNRILDDPAPWANADVAKQWTVAGTMEVVAVGGVNYYRRTGGAATMAKTFAAQSGWTAGFIFRQPGGPLSSNFIMFQLFDSATLHCDLRFNGSTGQLFVTRNGTSLGTGTAVLLADTDYYIEVQFVISDTVGVAIVKVNGVTDINLSSQDTRNGGNASANVVSFNGTNSTGAYYRAIYVNDNSGGVDDTFWGPINVVTHRVTGAGNSAGFTPSAGSNFQNVDETTPNDDTDYNSATASGVTDTFVVSDTGFSAGTIKGVRWVADAKLATAGASPRIAPVYRIGGTDYVRSDIALGTSYVLVEQLDRLSPASGSAWTVSELDGMEVGYKRTVT